MNMPKLMPHTMVGGQSKRLIIMISYTLSLLGVCLVDGCYTSRHGILLHQNVSATTRAAYVLCDLYSGVSLGVLFHCFLVDFAGE